MTKIGSLLRFGLPPDGSGVAPKSRMLRYFLRSSDMRLRGCEVAGLRGCEVARWAGLRNPATPQPRNLLYDALRFFEAVFRDFDAARFGARRGRAGAAAPRPFSRLRRSASMMSTT